jgi:hypothetical protein
MKKLKGVPLLILPSRGENLPLKITPKHPIRIDGKWMYPKDRSLTCDNPDERTVYSFVLEDTHIALVNGYECVTWGHAFKGDKVKHAYYGSQKVINDLMMFEGWNNGKVTIEENVREHLKNNTWKNVFNTMSTDKKKKLDNDDVQEFLKVFRKEFDE